MGRFVDVEKCVVEPKHDGDVEQDDAHCDEVHRDAPSLERLKEAGPHLQSDAIHEKYQTEVLHEVEHVGGAGVTSGGGVGNAERRVEMTDDDAGKQNERHTERDAAHLDFSKEHADRNDQCVQQHDMRH